MKHLAPKEAFDLLAARPDAVLIDCRSRAEHRFVGHPVGARHVAWNDVPDWDVNPHFVAEVAAFCSAARPVVLICRSGQRSIAAGQALEAAGFAEVCNVLGGFEGPLDSDHHRGNIAGWRHDGLPWEQPGCDEGLTSTADHARLPRMKHLTAREAHEFLAATPHAVFIDCRSEMEYLFVGHPVGALHVAWNDGPDWDINPHFVGQVRKIASMNRPVVIICRSGQRSVAAGEALEKAGFADVYNVTEGFEGPLDEHHHRNTVSGWRMEGLPWEQA